MTLASIKKRIPGFPKIYSKGIYGKYIDIKSIHALSFAHLIEVHFQSRFSNLLSAQDPTLVVRPAVLPAVHKAPMGWGRSGF